VTQSFANHRQTTPYYHFFTMPLGLIFWIWSVVRLVRNPTLDHLYFVIGASALAGAIMSLRLAALRNQDRIIRLEERIRLLRVLPPDLQLQLHTIRPKHLIALRFASDAEVVALVREVLATPSITPKAIKQRVREWQPDYFRV
jgi:hypothetical protein